MFTTGSKLLLGATVSALVGTLLYGLLVGGIMGTVGLVSLTVGLACVAGINISTRDANVAAEDAVTTSGLAASTLRPNASIWPLAFGVAAAVIVLGLVVHAVVVIIGIVLMLVSGLEWLLQSWSEGASSDRSHNREVRSRLAYTAEMPVAAAIGLGLIVFAFSRVMLGVATKSATIVAFAVVGSIVLLGGALISRSRGLSTPRMFGIFSVAGVVLLGGGAVMGLQGERDIEAHHTTAHYAELDECGTEEISADEHASQTVAGKASSAAEVILDDSGLFYELPGINQKRTGSIQLPRSSANNILFRNETNTPRRFIAELAEIEGSPARLCTALVEEGGVQLLTIHYPVPSFDPVVEESGGYALVVAGVDDRIEVVVP